VGAATADVVDAELPAVAGGRGAEADLGRQQHGQLEADVDGVGGRQLAVEGGEAAGLGPHAVGDGPAEAEEPSGQGVEVNGVPVAGDGGVLAADVGGDGPHGGRRRGPGGGGTGRAGTGTPQVGADLGPHNGGIHQQLADDVELLAPLVRPEVGGPDSEVEPLTQ
jgi:hypothetical protein